MIVVDYKVDKSSMVIWHETTGNKEKGGADGESTGEFDTSLEEHSSKSTIHDKSILANDSSSARNGISQVKHDDRLYPWKVTTDKGNNTDFPEEPSHAESDSERCKGSVDGSKCKRRKKQRFLTICTANCKYEVVRRVAARFRMREVTEDSSWDLYWTDMSVSVERAKDMKRFQRVNHFPGMTEICRKDLLARNLNRMLRMFPKDYNFFPKTWCFPADYGEAMTYAKLRRSKTFIIKPDAGCQGRGIYLTRYLKDIKPNERLICQVYIARPFLIDGYKFDLRIYALITSCDPLRIYVYNEGLARFATSKYKEPSGHNTSNMFMHLTNYSVNKHSRMYIIDDEMGSKRKISTLRKWMKARNLDVDVLWEKIDGIITKTVLAAYPILRHSYHACFPMHNKTYACFELLGFDILLDWKLRPYLLEVNHSPSFHTDAQIDKDVKEALLTDTFNILNLQQCDKKKIMEEDKKRIRERLLQGISGQSNDMTSPTKCERNESEYVQRQLQWEEDHMGNFRRIYPCSGENKYELFFTQSTLSVFQDTIASKAREEASRLEREENELKAKEEERRRLSGKCSEQKLNSENSSKKPQEKCKIAVVPKKNINKQDIQRSPLNVLYSFEPEIISESEERERVTALAQRDFLIKSYGMLEQIYLAMKKNGMLRPADEQKYGLYGRLGLQTNMDHMYFPSQRLQHRQSDRVDGEQQLQCHIKENEHKVMEHERNLRNSDKNLWITCNEALMYVRPKIPQKLWMEEMKYSNRKSRVTKTHVARTLSNTVRLHTIEKRESFHSLKPNSDIAKQR